MMTYNLPAEQIRARLEQIRHAGRGDFVCGDGFDQNDAPRLDAFIQSLGYVVTDTVKNGRGQLAEVTTACGLTIARNGYAHAR